MKVGIFAPSYKRPERSITQRTYPAVTLIVAESEAKAYTAGGNKILACPDAVQGNLCRVRNWILTEHSDLDCVVLMDDDCKGVFKWQHQIHRELLPGEFYEFCEMATIMAYDMGVKMWGINCIPDKGAYREHTPFSFVQYIGGPFSGHCKTDIFYDEDLPLKEDYDMTLQHLQRYGRVLRFNAYHYDVKQAEQKGGCAVYRNTDREREQFEMLQAKWGTKIIQYDKSSKKKFDFNPIMKSPIRGV